MSGADDRPSGMHPDRETPPWVWILLSILVALGAAGGVGWLLWNPHRDQGIELTYSVQWPEGPRSEQDLIDALRRRLEGVEPAASVSIRVRGETVELRILGIDPVRAPDFKRLLATRGLLELLPVADVPLQAKFNEDKIVPDGYRILQRAAPPERARYEAYGEKLLVLKASAIGARSIVHSEARQSLDSIGTPQWVTTFELDEDGARRFDEAAKMLFHRTPPGLLAIVLDGSLKSAPVVMSEKFAGRGQISGAKGEQEARDLAIILRSGALPAGLGRKVAGTFVPGEPESEKQVGPPK